ncbi:tRNA-dihydrouridine synthase [bacterium]|nr:tRNA-dihydrouridine synthase [bacterium]
MQSLWEQLPRPFFVQAPLEDVTDAAFRRMFALHGKPHVMWTEFTSADGLVLAQGSGLEKLRAKLRFSEDERPIVAQLFSAVPERMKAAASVVRELGFDGLDINMGCPDLSVEKGGAGAAHIKNPERASEIIAAAKEGVGNAIPVSVKTRLGYNVDEVETWIPLILKQNVAALTVHARTRKEMSLVPARWERLARVVELRDAIASQTRIIGNGDVTSLSDAKTRAYESGVDGVMVGRGLFGNPWFFTGYAASPHERITALDEHLHYFEKELTGITNYATMKKHFKAYISGWDGARELRALLMDTHSVSEARLVLTDAIEARGKKE